MDVLIAVGVSLLSGPFSKQSQNIHITHTFTFTFTFIFITLDLGSHEVQQYL